MSSLMTFNNFNHRLLFHLERQIVLRMMMILINLRIHEIINPELEHFPVVNRHAMPEQQLNISSGRRFLVSC